GYGRAGRTSRRERIRTDRTRSQRARRSSVCIRSVMGTADAKQPLAGKIAVVAGATRGAGRGIATMLGAAGATVICTGRSTRGNPATPGRPETIEETAELVTAAGGRGVAIRVDHAIADEVRALFERVERDFA